MVSNVIVFGTGVFFLRRKQMLPNETKIVAFLDNNKELEGKYLDGVLIYSPSDLFKLDYDTIILASASPIEMKTQLISLEVPESKIMFWEEYVSSKSHGILIKFEAKRKNIEKNQKKILIIVPIINYAGGFLTAFYAAIALKYKGYYVVIAAPTANDKTIGEVKEYGLDVWICPSLPYIGEIELEWIQQFDFVLINSLQNMICVSKIAEKVPLMWWLHENRVQYEDIIGQYGEKIETKTLKNAEIYAISNLARNYFREFIPDERVKRLAFGLPDFYNYKNYSTKNKIVIALIGTIVKRKNQLGFIKAIKKLSEDEKNRINCWIIGRSGGIKYNEEVERLAKDLNQMEICGELSREEIEQKFSEIDIVICTSLEETMSIVIAEGMMNKKICITNDNTGIAEFIEDGENGFIYKAGNDEDLLEKLRYVISNFDKLDDMRNKARQTYEHSFSMKRFSDDLQNIIENKLTKHI